MLLPVQNLLQTSGPDWATNVASAASLGDRVSRGKAKEANQRAKAPGWRGCRWAWAVLCRVHQCRVKGCYGDHPAVQHKDKTRPSNWRGGCAHQPDMEAHPQQASPPKVKVMYLFAGKRQQSDGAKFWQPSKTEIGICLFLPLATPFPGEVSIPRLVGTAAVEKCCLAQRFPMAVSAT